MNTDLHGAPALCSRGLLHGQTLAQCDVYAEAVLGRLLTTQRRLTERLKM